MSSVQESLTSALRYSVTRCFLHTDWGHEFPEVMKRGGSIERVYSIEAIARLILEHYGEEAVMNILAGTRLEGKWTLE